MEVLLVPLDSAVSIPRRPWKKTARLVSRSFPGDAFRVPVPMQLGVLTEPTRRGTELSSDTNQSVVPPSDTSWVVWLHSSPALRWDGLVVVGPA